VYDPSGDNPLVRMLDFFVFREHLCIVFELLSASIYDVLKKNGY
jgi:dual specificity protein kinase YAK1